MLPGRRRPVATSAGCRTTASAAASRNGLNFTERGFGVRGALGCSDRGHTAASPAAAGRRRLGRSSSATKGARWFHTGGIFAALSRDDRRRRRGGDGGRAAARHVVSYDLNYRASLWKAIGGQERAREVNRELAPLVDVMLGNEEDFTAASASRSRASTRTSATLDPAQLRADDRAARRGVPELRGRRHDAARARRPPASTTGARSPGRATDGFVEATPAADLEILDRVGGGDSFASGLIYGFLAGGDLQCAVEYGAAHGALAMTTPGDTSMATLAEVEALVPAGRPRSALTTFTLLPRIDACRGGRGRERDEVAVESRGRVSPAASAFGRNRRAEREQMVDTGLASGHERVQRRAPEKYRASTDATAAAMSAPARTPPSR